MTRPAPKKAPHARCAHPGCGKILPREPTTIGELSIHLLRQELGPFRCAKCGVDLCFEHVDTESLLDDHELCADCARAKAVA